METDAELVARVRSGEIEAFGTLSRRYEKTLLAAALARLRDIHAAEDAVQASLLIAFRQLGTLREDARFAPWLIQILRRQAVDAARVKVPASNREHDLDQQFVIEHDLGTWIEHEHLLALVARLSDRERLLIGLRYFDGHSMREIAAMSSRPLGTVTKQLSRAIARLRSWWDKEYLQ